jgi:methionyl-tRNA formyltransferase
MQKKIVFMGTPNFSIKTLEILSQSKYELSCVYTQPEKKSSRGQKLKMTPVHIMAQKLGIEVRTPEVLDEVEFEYLNSLSPYIVIVVAYGKIIPNNFLSIPKKGFINIHASLLPRWRGAAPIQRAIMNLDKETGISIMKINEGLDTGPFMKQLKISINDQTNSEELHDKLSKLGADNILSSIDLISSNNAKFIEQNNDNATYAKKVMKEESKILWTDSAKKILAKINALNPFPGAWFNYKGVRHKIWKAKISNLLGEPGSILSKKLIIACGDKSIEVIEIQKEGKTKLSKEEFLAGSKIIPGIRLS